MHQEISASTVFKVVEILIIASLLVLLPGGRAKVVGDAISVEQSEVSVQDDTAIEVTVQNTQ